MLPHTSFTKAKFVFVLALFILASCSGDNKNSSSSNGNSKPIANAGIDQIIPIGAQVTLDGSGSYDDDGDTLTYLWTVTSKPAGSTASLSDRIVTLPTFTADVFGTYVIELVVNDGHSDSVADSVTVRTTICNTDDIQGIPSTGSLTVGPSIDFVPLCNGTVLLGDRAANTVRKLDMVTGPTATFQLTAAPGDLELDPEYGLLYVAQSPATFVTKIDLAEGTQIQIAVSPGAVHLAVGNDGQVFASLDSSTYYHPIALMSGLTGTATKVFPATISRSFGELIAFDKAGNQLITGIKGLSPSSLLRFSYDSTQQALTESEYLWDAGENGTDIALSPDGRHIAFSAGAGNGTPPYTIYDFSSDGLTTVYGEWNTGAYPVSADFDPSGQYIVATNTSKVQIFSVATHVKIAEYAVDLSGCSYANLNKVRFSRGGKIVYAFATCGFYSDSGKLFWYVFNP